MRKIIALLIMSISGVALAQNPEIKTDLPTVLPPSPTVAALMKFEEVPVSNYTGTANVSIPLYSCSTLSSDVNLNISLKYNSSSVAADERSTNVGLGWSLFAGGTISRTVKGIPDEYYKIDKVGLYHNTHPNNPNNYYNYVNLIGSASTPQEFYTIEEFQWEAHEKGKYDSEHDLWQFNFMGQTGRFFIKKNTTTGMLEVKLLDNSNLKIENTYNTTNTDLQFSPLSFTIYDDKGYKYIFDIIEITEQNTFTESVVNIMSCNENGVDFNQYGLKTSQTPKTIYNSAFHLSKVYDNNNKLLLDLYYNNDIHKEIVIDETLKESKLINLDEAVFLNAISSPICAPGYSLDGVAEASKIQPKSVRTKSQRRTIVKNLSKIEVVGIAKIDFRFIKGREDTNFHHPDSSYVFKGITVRNWNNDSIKKINLSQSYSEILHKRMILTQVTESNFTNNDVIKHELYYKQNESSQIVGKDYWGYFNLRPVGYMGNYYREVNPDFASTDVLQKMVLPTGGSIIFDYESNSYSYESNTELTNFDDNPNNWIHTTSSPYNFTSNQSGVVQNLNFSATENQKITIFPDTASLGENGGVSLTKDGVVVNNYASLVCPNEIPNCGLDITLTAGSQYGLKMWWVNPNQTGAASVTVVYHTKKIPAENCLYGGGIRIKRIGYFDVSDVPQDFYSNYTSNLQTFTPKKEVNYNYNFFGTNISSGSLAFPKPVYNYQEEIEPGFHIVGVPNTMVLSYDVTTLFNNLPVIKTQGSDIGYQNVTVFETENGKTEYTYSSPIDVPEPDYSFSTRPPFLQSENLDYKKGLLKLEKVFDNSNRNLVETQFIYSYDNFSEVTGMKFYSFPINCPDCYRYVDYDQFKYCSNTAGGCYNPISDDSLGARCIRFYWSSPSNRKLWLGKTHIKEH